VSGRGDGSIRACPDRHACSAVRKASGGLFPPQRIAQLQGEHPRIRQAQPGKRYAGLLDVAGEEDEGSGPEAFDNASRRDSTALTIVEVETGGRELPLYRVVDRMAWTGTKHTALHDQLVDLAGNVWKLSALVIDATGAAPPWRRFSPIA
jgi:hypothetical protein